MAITPKQRPANVRGWLPLIEKIYHWTVNETAFGEDTEGLRRAKLTLYSAMILICWAPVYMAYDYIVLHSQSAAITVFCSGVLACFIPWILRTTESVLLAGNLLTFILWAVINISEYLTIAPGQPLPAWNVAVPIVALSIAGRISAGFWLVCSLASTIGFYLIDAAYFPVPPDSLANTMKMYNLMLLCSLTILVMSLALVYELTAKRALLNLTDAQSRLVQAGKMSALGEMAGGIAHEVNTPLAIIQMSAEQVRDLLAEKQFRDPAVSERLDTILETVSRIASVVSALRNFSRDGSRDEVRPETLRYILQNTISLCSERFSSTGIHFSIVHNKNPSTTIQCRWIEISQAILNILNNAADAIATAESRWIKILCFESEDTVQITIQDSGPGIPENLREKIFQPFFTTKEVGDGTGVGLSIAKSLIEANDGTLVLDTRSKNTSFVITLPKTS